MSTPQTRSAKRPPRSSAEPCVKAAESPDQAAPAAEPAAARPVTIKKYANRRLYNTATSSYVTLDHLATMVKENTDFVVYDAKSGEDITRAVLTQIIVEEENKGQNLLPISFLRQLISFYDHSLGGLVPRYLEHSMATFARQEEQMRGAMQNALEGMFPLQQFEEMNKQNMALFENALRMFTPFYADPRGAAEARRPEGQGEKSADSPQDQPQVAELRERLNRMQADLDALLADQGGKGGKAGTEG